MARAMKTRTARRVASPRSTAAPQRNENLGWTLRRARGLQIAESHALGKLGWLVHGFSTRVGGDSRLDGKPALNLGFTDWDERERVERNRTALAAALSAREMPLVTLRQFHSDVIHVVTAPLASVEEAPHADALVTRIPGLSARGADG